MSATFTALILGLPYPLALAIIAAILDLVPNIGASWPA
jgi:predicted PurR-regulated permease PerM